MLNTMTNFLQEVLRIVLLVIVLRTMLNFVLRGRLDKGKHQKMSNPRGYYDYKIHRMKLAQIRYARYKRRTKKVVQVLVKTLQFFKIKVEEFRRRVSKEDVPTIWTDFTSLQEESMYDTAEEPVVPYWTDFTAMQEESLIGTAPVYVPPVVTTGFKVSHDLL